MQVDGDSEAENVSENDTRNEQQVEPHPSTSYTKQDFTVVTIEHHPHDEPNLQGIRPNFVLYT